MPFVPKILIIDDEPRMCDSLKTLLDSQGYETQTGCNGREAIECLARDSFDLVLLDIVMPDMSGHDIMDHINSKCPETVVIVMTGHASVDSAINSLRRQVYDYLRKPVDFQHLLKRVKNAIDQSRLRKAHDLVSGKLEVTERRYRFLVNVSPDIIYTLDHEGKFTFVGGAIESLLGYEGHQLVGKHYSSIVCEEDMDKAKNHCNERRTGKRVTTGVELRLKCGRKGKKPKPFQIRCLPVELKAMGIYDRSVHHKDKEFLGTYGVARDITNRKRAEEQMKLSLREKEALLNEIHHRVRNNFQIISSLLDLTSMRIDNQQVIDLLSEARAKIHAMALVHAQLYEQERFDQVDMGGHIRKLVEYLSDTYAGRERCIHTMMEISGVYLAVGQAIPCALVLSEIISNAFKHAFVEKEKGTIEISMQRSADDTIFVSVKDDGIGITEEVDIDKANTLGLKLVRNVVQSQLNGKVQLKRDNGAEIIIEFKALEEREKYA